MHKDTRDRRFFRRRGQDSCLGVVTCGALAPTALRSPNSIGTPAQLQLVPGQKPRTRSLRASLLHALIPLNSAATVATLCSDPSVHSPADDLESGKPPQRTEQ